MKNSKQHQIFSQLKCFYFDENQYLATSQGTGFIPANNGKSLKLLHRGSNPGYISTIGVFDNQIDEIDLKLKLLSMVTYQAETPEESYVICSCKSLSSEPQGKITVHPVKNIG